MAEAFSTWFCHTSLGEDKRPSLERALRLWEQQATRSPVDPTPLINAARLRLHSPQVRDVDDAARLLLEARACRSQTRQQRDQIAQLTRTLERAQGTLRLPKNFDYTDSYDCRQERLMARTQTREFNEADDQVSLEIVLTHLYRLAIVAELEHHILLHLPFKVREAAQQALRKKANRVRDYSYADHGPLLERTAFLGVNDRKLMVSLWGNGKAQLDPLTLFRVQAVAPYVT